MSSVQLSSLSHWGGVVVVDEDAVVVSKELASEDILIVAFDLGVE